MYESFYLRFVRVRIPICASMNKNLSVGMSKCECEFEWGQERVYNCTNECRYEFTNTSMNINLNASLSSNVSSYTIEPCTITFVGDGYLVHPVYLWTTGSYPVPGNEQYPVPGKSGYWVWGRGKGGIGYPVLGYLVRVMTGYLVYPLRIFSLFWRLRTSLKLSF